MENTTTQDVEFEGIASEEAILEEPHPGGGDSVLALFFLGLFTLAVCACMGGLWMYMLGIELSSIKLS